MKSSKLFEKGPVPLPSLGLSGAVRHNFFIYKVEQTGTDATLSYVVESHGISIYAENKTVFDWIPSQIEIVSGGWYGDKGRWAPLERSFGTLLCKNVKELKTLSKQGKDFTFDLKKTFFFNRRKLLIENQKIGQMKLVCQSITPQDFTVCLYSKIVNQWVPRLELVEKLEIDGERYRKGKVSELLQAMRNEFSDGVELDEIPEGEGEFGHNQNNPIPVIAVRDSYVYLERLRTLEGKKVQYTRVSTVYSDNIPNPIDWYEIMVDGEVFANLYISPYNQKNSERTPKGFEFG